MRWVTLLLLFCSCSTTKRPQQLDASGSYDPDGYIVEWKWRVISGPGKLSATRAMRTGISKGATIELTVVDNKGAVGKDTVVIK